MPNKITIGGTASFRAIDETGGFAIAASGDFNGGYAKITGINDASDGKKNVVLQHYLLADDGSYIYTQDKAVHTPVTESRFAAITEYTIVKAGGRFEGLTGTFKSMGMLDYSTGVGAVRFEGEIGF
jgi:hypothetical protein